MTAYVSLTQLAARLSADGNGIDGGTDDELDRVRETASRAVDAECGRRFYLDTSASARYFWPSRIWVDGRAVCDIDDCASITSVALDATDTNAYSTTLVANTDYRTEPTNSIRGGIEGWPIDRLVRLSTTSQTWRCDGDFPAIKVSATWGWSSVPSAVEDATLAVAADLFARRAVTFGVSNDPVFGGVRVSRDVMIGVRSLLTPYMRRGLGIGTIV